MLIDPLGQEIRVGARVLWSSCARGSGFDGGVHVVEKVGESRASIRFPGEARTHAVPPHSLLVIDAILAARPIVPERETDASPAPCEMS
ncbi:hypothetical protein LAZ40_02240 [Cereibacter sphaeroides]|uniref:hypothetical protein n=1 Tax=Cereibacter sphaeroides TaxID=1063 RepID=UPI001F35EA25|nr:hypothetical protein [Cereibacter sphaeroides]MCE6957877.1 hypothetical protein [Cereibacter sphaeroides]MCE6971846.1 hypothetical protein [Cereibacter sphaeroides]